MGGKWEEMIGKCVGHGMAIVLALMGILALLSFPLTSERGAPSTAVRGNAPLHATLTDTGCPDLLGTVEWTGFFGYYNHPGGNSNPWGVNLTEASDGSLTGTMTGPNGFVGDPIVGSVSCNQITFGILPSLQISATGNVSISGSTLAASGTWIAGNCCNGTWIATAILGPVVSIAPASLPAVSGPVSYAVTVTGAGTAPTGSVEVADDEGGACSISSLTAGAGSCAINESASLSPYTVTASYSGDSNYSSAVGSISNATTISADGSASTGSHQVTATASGGTDGIDSVTESQYGADPVGALTDGFNYFDVAISSGSTFSSVVVRDCNDVTALTNLDWWNPNAGVGGRWQQVAGDPDPTYSPGPPSCISVTLTDTSNPSLSQLTGTVFATVPSRVIASANSLTILVGQSSSAVVTATGSPTPSLRTKGKMPHGLRLVDNHNGTAGFVGKPSQTAGGEYHVSIIATYGRGSIKQKVTQGYTLFVFQPPAIVSRTKVSATVGRNYRLNVKARGFPRPSITESGALPNGITLRPNNDGTAALTGVPTTGSAGSYPITIRASNGEGNPASQSFMLMVKS